MNEKCALKNCWKQSGKIERNQKRIEEKEKETEKLKRTKETGHVTEYLIRYHRYFAHFNMKSLLNFLNLMASFIHTFRCRTMVENSFNTRANGKDMRDIWVHRVCQSQFTDILSSLGTETGMKKKKKQREKETQHRIECVEYTGRYRQPNEAIARNEREHNKQI